MFRTVDLLAVDGFDERYFMYWEDVDLCARLRARGGRIVWLPWARVEHAAGGSSGGGRSRLRKYLMAQNAVRFLKSRGSVAAWAGWFAGAIMGLGLGFAAVIHPAAVIADTAEIEPGAFLAAGAVVNPDARIGAHAIVNTGATVDHDTQVGEFAFVGPNAALAGGVVVGHGAMVGIGACVVPGVAIGAHATVGAGAVVIDDVGAGEHVAGNPARRLPEPAGSARLR